MKWSLAFALLLAFATVSTAGTVTVRSGDGVDFPTSDPNVTMLLGPVGTLSAPGFGAAFTPADFAAASAGPAAFVIDGHPNWKPYLTSDATGEWISTLATGASAETPSALYAIDFDLGMGTFASVTLDFRFLVDNDLGDQFNEGLFINGTGISGTRLTGVVLDHFQVDQAMLGLDVTALVNSGVNTLYIDAANGSGPAGIQFSATFNTTLDPGNVVPLPGAASLGFAMLGLLAVGARIRRRHRHR